MAPRFEEPLTVTFPGLAPTTPANQEDTPPVTTNPVFVVALVENREILVGYFRGH